LNNARIPKKNYGNGICVICGVEFVKLSNNNCVCSEECKGIRNKNLKEQKKKEMKLLKEQQKKAEEEKKSIETLSEVAKKASDAGMTYGKYMEARSLGRI
jgi:predicted nucleic acid-binding Zn ribbon protein